MTLNGGNAPLAKVNKNFGAHQKNFNMYAYSKYTTVQARRRDGTDASPFAALVVLITISQARRHIIACQFIAHQIEVMFKKYIFFPQ